MKQVKGKRTKFASNFWKPGLWKESIFSYVVAFGKSLDEGNELQIDDAVP